MSAFQTLEPEYAALIAAARIRPECKHVLEITGQRLLHDKAIYAEVSNRTGVPIAVLMALSEREMSGNLHCYLGNGQLLTRRTTIVPIGRGPFDQMFPDNFVFGALDALHLDGLDKVASTIGWSMPSAAYESEEWNGEGYRHLGIPSPYVFGGTTVQKTGKFVHDHVFDRTVMDPQLGTIAIIDKLIELDPTLAFADAIPKVESPSIIPIMPHPVIGNTNIQWVQTELNRLRGAGTPLAVDGNCGRGTRAAVRAFQERHRLVVDGLPGSMTVRALTDAIAEAGL